MDFDEDFAGAGDGVWAFFDGEALDGAEFVADDGLHAGSPVVCARWPGG
jgi:hypothetical protein